MALGKPQNRRIGRIPLAHFIALIPYKAEAAGLVVPETEESYTGQASFVNNEELRTIEPARRHEGKKTGETKAAAAAAGTAGAGGATGATGKRLKHE